MKSIRFEPVKWMTGLLAILMALSGAGELMNILPARVQAGILIAIAVLTAVLGAVTHRKVTPLARPRNNDGQPLAPLRSNQSAF